MTMMRITTALFLLLATVAYGAERGSELLPPRLNYYIPVAGHGVNGAGDTFDTTLRIYNASNYQTQLTVEFWSGPSSTVPFTVQIVDLLPRANISLTRIVTDNRIGAIHISNPTTLVVTADAFMDRRATHAGTLGQLVPAITEGQLLIDGAISHINEAIPNPNLSVPPEGFRTNVGFFNPTAQDITIALDLRNDFGNSLGRTTINLGPHGQTQRSLLSLFGVFISPSRDLTLRFHASQAVAAYGSLVDWQSGAPLYVPAAPDAPDPQ